MSVTTEVFHKNGASKNIELIKNGKRAKRKDASSLDGSVVFSKSPLRPDVKYEVKLIDASCTTYLHVGVTIDDPQAEDVRWTYWRVVDDVSWRLLDQSNTWVREEHMGWCGRVVRACGKPLQVDIGDTVAVMRTSNDEIHFIVNGEDQGLSFLVGPLMRIWAVVEMETTGKVIALPPYDGPAAARSRIRRPVVERSDSHASGDQVSLDEEDLDEQRSLLQCFGDMGISQGATAAEIDENLEPAAFNMRAGKNIILRDNYTTAKRRGIANIGQAIVFTAQPLQDDVMFQAKVEGISGETYINMGVTPINPAYLEDHSIPERLFKMRCDSCVLNMNNLFYDGVYLRPYGSDSHRTVSRGDKVGILKTASGDIHFYQNGANMGKALSNREGPLWGIFEILEDDLILQAASSGSRTVPLLPEGTDMYGQSQQGDYSTDEDNELISQARGMTPEPVEPPASVLTPPPTPAEPTVVTPPPSSPVSPPPASPVSPPPAAAPVPVPAPAPVPECPYKSICTKFIDSLELGDDLFQKNFDTCFCLSCHQRRGDNFYYERGQPAKTYGIPIGWCKFGLHAPPRANMLNVFTKWHMAFHGTKHYLLKSIFGTGDLLMPGDVTIDGVVIKPPPNHFQKSTAEFDIKRVFLSPSIKYAGCDVYAPKEDWTEADTRTKRKVRVALQVRIKPDSYAVGRETIGLKDRQMDEKFPNTELEWATAHRGAVILCGVLVKIEDWMEPSTTPIGSAATTLKSVIAQARGFDG